MSNSLAIIGFRYHTAHTLQTSIPPVRSRQSWAVKTDNGCKESPYHSWTGGRGVRPTKQADCELPKSPSFRQTAEAPRSKRANCGNISSSRGDLHVLGSCNSLDPSHGIYRIHSDQPGAANVQQPLNYRSIPRSFSRIFSCCLVHSAREAATKTCFRCPFHCTNLPGLGHIPRKPRLTSESKALIPTGRLSPG